MRADAALGRRDEYGVGELLGGEGGRFAIGSQLCVREDLTLVRPWDSRLGALPSAWIQLGTAAPGKAAGGHPAQDQRLACTGSVSVLRAWASCDASAFVKGSWRGRPAGHQLAAVQHWSHHNSANPVAAPGSEAEPLH